MATYQDFEDIMSRNYGTQHYYTNLFTPKFLYTDGVREMAETFGCYWLIDMVESHLMHIMPFVSKNLYETELMTSCTMDVILDVKDNKANFSVVAFGYDDDKDEEIETVVTKQEIGFTDMPDGTYKLFLGAEDKYVLFLTSEY